MTQDLKDIMSLNHEPTSGDIATLLPDVGGAHVLIASLALFAAFVFVALLEQQQSWEDSCVFIGLDRLSCNLFCNGYRVDLAEYHVLK